MKQKYKVFLNDRLIEICAPEDAKKIISSLNSGKIHRFLKLRIGLTILLQTTLLRFFNPPGAGAFFSRFSIAFSRNARSRRVVIREGRLLFIFRNGKWDLPKGKSEKGNFFRNCAQGSI